MPAERRKPPGTWCACTIAHHIELYSLCFDSHEIKSWNHTRHSIETMRLPALRLLGLTPEAPVDHPSDGHGLYRDARVRRGAAYR